MKCLRRIATFVLSIAAMANAQSISSRAERLEWLKQNAIPIRSIDPADDDFDDLKPVGDAIGDARLVMLGEGDHGDGATMLAKTRVVKYLYERKGFDVLIWESGFYECLKANAELAAGRAPDEVFESALLPIWSGSAQCLDAFEFIAASHRTDRPLTLAGMSWYVYEDSALFDDVIPFLQKVDPALPTPEQVEALDALRRQLADRGKRGFPKASVDRPELGHVRAMIESTKDVPEAGDMRLALENLIAFVGFWNRPLSRGGVEDDPLGAMEARNVLYLVKEKFPERKIIVWAHTGHLARNLSQVEELGTKFKTAESMPAGHHIHKALGRDVFTIAFIAHGGSTGLWWDEPRQLPASPPDSLESLFDAGGFEYAFLDLRRLPPKHWLRSGLIASPIAHSPMRADWTRVVDAFFFLDRMNPSTRAKGYQPGSNAR